jgi:YggT family protein
MVSQAIAFVLETLFNIVILSALVRFWMQALRAPTRNPIAQFTMALTDWAVKPLRRVIPGAFKLDLASLVVAWALEFVLQILLFWLMTSEAPGASALSVLLFLALVKLIRLSIYIFMIAVILQAVMSWVSPHHPAAPFFDGLTRPFMRPVQKTIPTIGGIDVSPIFVLLFFQLLLMLPVTWLENQALRMAARAAL